MSFGTFLVEPGKALPTGASLTENGVNFSLFSRNAKSITLVLFESTASDSAYQKLQLD
ncbi:MAG: hypothetical protein LBT14_00495, partial [Treponema sp.]|nr:hypothetical protein [Treponema sp.]